MNFKKSFSVLVLGAVVVLTNCASLGDPYKKPNVSNDKALVVIYRSSAFVGFANSFDVKKDGAVVTTLKNGGFFPLYVKPGKVVLTAETLENKAEVNLDLKSGQIVYVKGRILPGVVAGRAELALVGEQYGEEEASKCKEIPAQN